MRAMICLLIIFVAGCATTQLPDVPTETKIPVGTPCLTPDKVPVKPEFVTDAQLFAKDEGQFVISLAKDRLDRQEYEGRLEATLKGCISTAPIPEPIEVPSPVPNSKPWWQFW